MFKSNVKLECVYFNKFKRTFNLNVLRLKYFGSKLNENKLYSVCGRIYGKRVMGKSLFLNLQDFYNVIQLYFSREDFDNCDYDKIVSVLSLGDIVGVKGKCFFTKTREFSFRVYEIVILSKNFELFPDKWKGLLEKELCYRKRYLDLMVNKKTRDIFVIRSKVIQYIREFFLKANYLEVETPIMQNIPGGASAKPFITYHNYLETDLYLRISPELYLKRLIVGGFDKIFEIGKSFRNEGISNRHNPEFTMIEFYQAYSDYRNLMILTEKLFRFLCKKLKNGLILNYQGLNIDFFSRFLRISFRDSIIKYNKDLVVDDLNNRTNLCTYMSNKGFLFPKDSTLSDLQNVLFEETVEKNLIYPTFIVFHPVDISPLAKSCSSNSFVTERFELYIYGREIANGFSELNDPFEQSKRFKNQSELKINNDSDCNLLYDSDYINALRYGLPPTAGEGIGIDRLVMLFTDSANIKDVLLFPLMRLK